MPKHIDEDKETRKMDVKEKLVELLEELCLDYGATAIFFTSGEAEIIADLLIANGVTVQDDMKELIGRGLDNIYWRIYGTNKEFNERMAGYNPSSFCAGFQYAIQLAKGLLTQLPHPPKGEKETTFCKDCEHLMFSDCYGECSKGHKGIVKPNDTCKYATRKLPKGE